MEDVKDRLKSSRRAIIIIIGTTSEYKRTMKLSKQRQKLVCMNAALSTVEQFLPKGSVPGRFGPLFVLLLNYSVFDPIYDVSNFSSTRTLFNLIQFGKWNVAEFRPMTRATFFLTTLLVGLLGSGNAKNQIITSAGDPRLAWAPEDGCVPGASTTFRCPLKMDCFPHKSFKNGGFCDCNPLFINFPHKLPFDNSEWDDGFDSSDCASWSFVKFILGAFHLYCVIWCLACMHTNILVTAELFKNKALKANATTYALFFSFFGALANGLCWLVYWLNTWDMEPEYYYNRRGYIFVYGLQLCLVPADAEIGCTWIDLVDRTQKMSKSSSRNLKILRWVVRIVGLAVSGWMVNGILSGSIGGLLNSAVYPSAVSGVFIAIAGFLIVRTICPDLKDNSNPNWKVANSIVRTTKYSVLGKMLEITGLLGMLGTGKGVYVSYVYGFFNCVYFWGYIFRIWAYISYIIAGNRKHLKRYESDSVSGFFGLSTIGLNKTVTRASSAFSSRASSAASSVADPDDK